MSETETEDLTVETVERIRIYFGKLDPEEEKFLKLTIMDLLKNIYTDRNLAVQALAKLAYQQGMKVGVRFVLPDWPVIYIGLPTGQVSWHIPSKELEVILPNYTGVWDEHDTEEKMRRVRDFLLIDKEWEETMRNVNNIIGQAGQEVIDKLNKMGNYISKAMKEAEELIKKEKENANTV